MVELAAEGRFERLGVLILGRGWSSPDESWRRSGRMTRALASSSLALPRVSWVTHQSHNSQPRKVAKLPQPTTDMGLTRSWNMPTKQTMNIMTEQTCCTMTVVSATRGQKSYGRTRGFRWRFSRKVAWSV